MTDHTTHGPATDPLAEPIRIRLDHTTIAAGGYGRQEAAAATNAAELIRARAEAVTKLKPLSSHYRVARTGDDGADSLELKLQMAARLHPGFTVVDLNEPKPSPWARTNPLALVMLLADVEMLKREKRPRVCSDGEACRRLTTHSRFTKRWHGFNPRTLQNWLPHARRDMIALWRMAQIHEPLRAFFETPTVSRR